ncbi:MAG: thioredoxin [Clostridia bacterium]|nr:thioredoxin [Clostridia bacterium]
MITKIENEKFDEVLSAKYALVDFSATWCGPCRMLAPVIDELSDELDGTVEFFNADVDDNMGLAQKYGISSIPALILFKDGKPVDSMVGFRPKEDLRAFIENTVEA